MNSASTPSDEASGAPAQRWIIRLWPLATWQLTFVAAVSLLKSAANALVLHRYQAGALPYLYVAAAAITAALTGLLAARAGRTSRGPAALALGGAAFVLAARFGLESGWVVLGLYLFAESFATYAAIRFWGVMSESFDPRESRRAFTVVSGIGMGGGVVGGWLAHFLAHEYGSGALITAAACFLVVGAAALGIRSASATQAVLPKAPGVAEGVWRFLVGQSYARWLGLLVLAMSVSSALVDFLFRQRAAEKLGLNELAALFGELHVWMALFCVVFQLGLGERLLRRAGILRYLATVPAVLVPLALLAVLDGSVWPAFALKVLQDAAGMSVLPVGVQLLYAPVPDAVRDGTRSAMDGFVKKGGLALAGLALIAIGGYAKGAAVPWALVALAAAAIGVIWRLRPAYVGALEERVSGAMLAPGSAYDGVTETVLAEALHGGNLDRSLKALSFMEQAGMEIRRHLPRLLQNPDERMVTRAVQLALACQATEVAPALERILRGRDRRPRDEAIRALARLAPTRAARVLPPLLEAPDVGLRCAAIGSLFAVSGGDFAAQGALQGLVARGELAPAAERREVARLLGHLRDERWGPVLARYLDDGDGSVRRIAIAAVGEGGYLSLAPRLLPFLTWREERRSAREALAKLGDAVTPLLEQALNDRSRTAALRYQVPRVLRQIGTARSLEALLFSNVRDDAFLHYRIGLALSRLREESPELPVDANRVREALDRRKEVYGHFATTFVDLRIALGDEALLTRAVGDRLDQAFELSFWLLGLLYPAKPLRRVHAHLVGSDSRRRAWALELLENLVPPEDRAYVREPIDRPYRVLTQGTGRPLPDVLSELGQSDDQVLRAVARSLARKLGLWDAPASEDEMTDATVKRMFALEGVEIFAQSDVDDVAAVAALAEEQTFRKGERIYSEGDPGDALYVVLEGRVDALKHGQHVMTMGEKQAFGEVSLLDGSPRPVDMVAAEDCRCLVIDRRDFLDLISDRPELLKGVFRVVTRQLKEVLDLPTRGASERGVK